MPSDGGSIAVDITGTGPLVICSHALSDNRASFGPLSLQLAASGFRVVNYDIRGHGESTAHFSRYGDEPTADDIELLIDTYSNGLPVVLIGASMSGSAATLVAARRPAQIAGLVLIGAFLRNTAGPILRAIFNVLLYRPLGPILWRGQTLKLWPGLGDRATTRSVEIMDELTRPGRWVAFRETVRGADHSIVTPQLGKITCPCLVVMGESDPDWTDPIAEGNWMVSALKDAQLVTVKGAGHAPHYEMAEEVCPKVVSFVQKVLA